MEIAHKNKRYSEEIYNNAIQQNALLQTENQQLITKINLITEQYESLKRQLIDLRQQHFGSKTETFIAEQGVLFGDVVVEESEPETEHIEFDRKKPRKKTHPHHIIPDHLPRTIITYELSAAECLCPCGCGTTLQKIGEVVSERLEIKRPELYVNRHVRFKYGGCPHAIKAYSQPTCPLYLSPEVLQVPACKAKWLWINMNIINPCIANASD